MFMSAVVLNCRAAAGLMTVASADRHEAAAIELAAIAAPPLPPMMPPSWTGRVTF